MCLPGRVLVNVFLEGIDESGFFFFKAVTLH